MAYKTTTLLFVALFTQRHTAFVFFSTMNYQV